MKRGYINLVEIEGMRYPNLVAAVNWNICGKPAIACHAGITRELFDAALSGDEKLTHDEMVGISRLTKIPVSVLELPKLALMSCNKFQHIMKVMDLRDDFNYIKEKRTEAGKGEDIDIKSSERELDTYARYFKKGNGTYVGYMAVRQKIDWNFWLYLNIDQKKPRGLKR